MARAGVGRLRIADLKRKTPGMLADGGNLYLVIRNGKAVPVGAASAAKLGAPFRPAGA